MAISWKCCSHHRSVCFLDNLLHKLRIPHPKLCSKHEFYITGQVF